MFDNGIWFLFDSRSKMNRRKIVTVCGTALLIAAAVVVALRDSSRESPLPEVPVAQTPAEVRVKAVERKPRDAWGLSPFGILHNYL